MKENDNILLTEKPGNLMKKYSVPCIISLLVAALYNIVDQLFIANASYLGSYGNAAKSVGNAVFRLDPHIFQAYPLTYDKKKKK